MKTSALRIIRPGMAGCHGPAAGGDLEKFLSKVSFDPLAVPGRALAHTARAAVPIARDHVGKGDAWQGRAHRHGECSRNPRMCALGHLLVTGEPVRGFPGPAARGGARHGTRCQAPVR